MAKNNRREIDVQGADINLKKLQNKLAADIKRVNEMLADGIGVSSENAEKFNKVKEELEHTKEQYLKLYSDIIGTLKNLHNYFEKNPKIDFQPLSIMGQNFDTSGQFKDYIDKMESEFEGVQKVIQKQINEININMSNKPLTARLQTEFQVEDTKGAVDKIVQDLYDNLNTSIKRYAKDAKKDFDSLQDISDEAFQIDIVRQYYDNFSLASNEMYDKLEDLKSKTDTEIAKLNKDDKSYIGTSEFFINFISSLSEDNIGAANNIINTINLLKGLAKETNIADKDLKTFINSLPSLDEIYKGIYETRTEGEGDNKKKITETISVGLEQIYKDAFGEENYQENLPKWENRNDTFLNKFIEDYEVDLSDFQSKAKEITAQVNDTIAEVNKETVNALTVDEFYTKYPNIWDETNIDVLKNWIADYNILKQNLENQIDKLDAVKDNKKIETIRSDLESLNEDFQTVQETLGNLSSENISSEQNIENTEAEKTIQQAKAVEEITEEVKKETDKIKPQNMKEANAQLSALCKEMMDNNLTMSIDKSPDKIKKIDELVTSLKDYKTKFKQLIDEAAEFESSATVLQKSEFYRHRSEYDDLKNDFSKRLGQFINTMQSSFANPLVRNNDEAYSDYTGRIVKKYIEDNIINQYENIKNAVSETGVTDDIKQKINSIIEKYNQIKNITNNLNLNGAGVFQSSIFTGVDEVVENLKRFTMSEKELAEVLKDDQRKDIIKQYRSFKEEIKDLFDSFGNVNNIPNDKIQSVLEAINSFKNKIAETKNSLNEIGVSDSDERITKQLENDDVWIKKLEEKITKVQQKSLEENPVDKQIEQQSSQTSQTVDKAVEQIEKQTEKLQAANDKLIQATKTDIVSNGESLSNTSGLTVGENKEEAKQTADILSQMKAENSDLKSQITALRNQLQEALSKQPLEIELKISDQSNNKINAMLDKLKTAITLKFNTNNSMNGVNTIKKEISSFFSSPDNAIPLKFKVDVTALDSLKNTLSQLGENSLSIPIKNIILSDNVDVSNIVSKITDKINTQGVKVSNVKTDIPTNTSDAQISPETIKAISKIKIDNSLTTEQVNAFSATVNILAKGLEKLGQINPESLAKLPTILNKLVPAITSYANSLKDVGDTPPIKFANIIPTEAVSQRIEKIPANKITNLIALGEGLREYNKTLQGLSDNLPNLAKVIPDKTFIEEIGKTLSTVSKTIDTYVLAIEKISKTKDLSIKSSVDNNMITSFDKLSRAIESVNRVIRSFDTLTQKGKRVSIELPNIKTEVFTGNLDDIDKSIQKIVTLTSVLEGLVKQVVAFNAKPLNLPDTVDTGNISVSGVSNSKKLSAVAEQEYKKSEKAYNDFIKSINKKITDNSVKTTISDNTKNQLNELGLYFQAKVDELKNKTHLFKEAQKELSALGTDFASSVNQIIDIDKTYSAAIKSLNTTNTNSSKLNLTTDSKNNITTVTESYKKQIEQIRSEYSSLDELLDNADNIKSRVEQIQKEYNQAILDIKQNDKDRKDSWKQGLTAEEQSEKISSDSAKAITKFVEQLQLNREAIEADPKLSNDSKFGIIAYIEHFKEKAKQLYKDGLDFDVQGFIDDYKNQLNVLTNEIKNIDKNIESSIDSIKKKNNAIQANVDVSDKVKQDVDSITNEYIANLENARKTRHNLEDVLQEIDKAQKVFDKKYSQIQSDDKKITAENKAYDKAYNDFIKKADNVLVKFKGDITKTDAEKSYMEQMRGKLQQEVDNLKTQNLSLEETKKALQDIYSNTIVNAESSSKQYNKIVNVNSKLLNDANAFVGSGQTDNVGNIQESIGKYNDIIEKARNGSIGLQDAMVELNAAAQELQKNLSEQKFDLFNKANIAKLEGLMSKIEKILAKGRLTETTKTGQGLINLRNSVQEQLNAGGITKSAILDYEAQFNNLMAEASREGLTGASGIKKMLNSAASVFRKVFAGDSIYRLLSQLRQVPTVIRQIDTEMTNLKRVTTATSDEYDKFLVTATVQAKQLGTSVKDMIEATASFGRLGYNLRDANELAQAATIYKNVGWLDINTATNDLVSTMKAFNLTANDSIHIVDVLDVLGNKFALTSADVGTGLKNSASALASANNSMEQTAAMITAITEITQDPGSAGMALRTLSLRIRSTKAELQEMGEETEGAVNTTAKLRKQIKGITGVDILKNSGEFKSTYEIMQGIAGVWKDLSDTEQASILESLAGKTRANQVAALLNNWSQAERALSEAVNSSGVALKENDIYLKSAEGRIQQLKATAQSAANEVINSDELKAAYKVATDLLETLIKVKGITIPGLTAMFTAINGARNKELSPTQFLKSLEIGTWFKKIDFSEDYKKLRMNWFGIPVSGMDDQQLKSYKSEIDELAKSHTDLTEAQKINYKQMMLQAQSVDDATVSLYHLNHGLKDTERQSKLAAMGAKAVSFALDALVGIFAGLAINFLIKGITTLIQRQEKLTETAISSANKLNEEVDGIDKLKDKIGELTESLRDGNLSQTEAYEKRKEIISIQDELAEKYGIERIAVDELNSSYEKYIENIEKSKKEKSSDWLDMNGEAISGANDTLGFGSWIDRLTRLFKNRFNSAIFDLPNDYRPNSLVDINSTFLSGSLTTSFNLKDIMDAYKRFLDDTKDNVEYKNNPELKEQRDRVATAYQELMNSEEYKNAVSVLEQEAEAKVAADEVLNKAYSDATVAVEKYQKAIEQGDTEGMSEAIQDIDNIYSKYSPYFSDEYIKAVFDKLTSVATEDIEGRKAVAKTDLSRNPDTDTYNAWFTKFDTQEAYTKTELLNKALDESSMYYWILSQYAEKYGLSIEEVADVLVELGVLQRDFATNSYQTRPFAAIIKDTEDAQKVLANFDSAISKLSAKNSGTFLTEDELNTLLGYDETLIDSVTRTTEGYQVAIGNLVKARTKYYNTQKANIQTNIDDTISQIDDTQSTIERLSSKENPTVNDTDNLKAAKQNLSELETQLASYKVQLLELEPPTIDFRDNLGNITSQAQSTRESLVQMEYEQEKFGHINANTAVSFIAATKNWQDYISVGEDGHYVLNETSDDYEKLIKQTSGYNDTMSALNTQQKMQTTRAQSLTKRIEELARQGKTGTTEFNELQSELNSVYVEMGLTTNQIKTLDNAFSKFFKTLNNPALIKFNNKLKDLDLKKGLGEITDTQYMEEYNKLVDDLEKGTQNVDDPNVIDERNEQRKQRYQNEVTMMKNEAEKALTELDRQLAEGYITSADKAEQYMALATKYYAKGTLLGDTDEGIREYANMLANYNQQIITNAKTTADKVKTSITNAYDDGTIDIREQISRLSSWNESNYGAGTLLGRSEEGQKTYLENRREISKLSEQADKSDYDKSLELLKENYDDRKITDEEYLKARTTLNEKYYGKNGLLANTRDAIDNRTYEKNAREIATDRETAYQRELKEYQRMLDKGTISVEQFYQYQENAANKWLKNIPQLTDAFNEAMDNVNINGTKAILDEQLRTLSNQRSMNVINAKDYWSNVVKLYQDASAKTGSMTKELEDKMVEYRTTGMREMYEEDIKISQQSYDKGEILLSQHIQNQIDAWKKYYKDKKELADEDLQAQQDIYNGITNAYQDQISALEDKADLLVQPYQDEIDMLNKSKDEFTKATSKKVKQLTKQKEALEKVNAQQKNHLELLKAQNDLAEAELSTRIVYGNGGWNLERDEQKYQEALANLEDKQKQTEVEAIQSQIDSINDATEAITDKIDEEIENRTKQMEVERQGIDAMIHIYQNALKLMNAGNIDVGLMVGMLNSEYGRESLDRENRKNKFYDNTVSGIKGMFSQFLPQFQKLNKVNGGITDEVLTQYAPLFNNLANLYGSNALVFSGLSSSGVTGEYAKDMEKYGAYTQLFGNKKFDPKTDKIELEFQKGMYLTSDGAILIAEGLAKDNQDLATRIKKGYNVEAAQKYNEENTKQAEETTTENTATITDVNTTLGTTNGCLLALIQAFNKANPNLAVDLPAPNSTVSTDKNSPSTVSSFLTNTFGNMPVININVEGSADSKTVQAISQETNKTLMAFTNNVTTKINNMFTRFGSKA